MAKEIMPPGLTPGATMYAMLRSRTTGLTVRDVAGTKSYEAYNGTHLAQYANALTETPTGSGNYVADFPALAADTYDILVYKQAGGSPAGPAVDTFQAARPIEWNGTAEAPTVTVGAFASGTVPANFAATQINGAGKVSIDLTTALTVGRVQDTNTAPTIEDGLIGGFLGTFGRAEEDDTAHTYKVKTIAGVTVRTFTLTNDSGGNPIARA